MTNEDIAVAVQNGQPELMEQLWKQCRRFIGQQALKWAKAMDQAKRLFPN